MSIKSENAAGRPTTAQVEFARMTNALRDLIEAVDQLDGRADIEYSLAVGLAEKQRAAKRILAAVIR